MGAFNLDSILYLNTRIIFFCKCSVCADFHFFSESKLFIFTLMRDNEHLDKDTKKFEYLYLNETPNVSMSLDSSLTLKTLELFQALNITT